MKKKQLQHFAVTGAVAIVVAGLASTGTLLSAEVNSAPSFFGMSAAPLPLPHFEATDNHGGHGGPDGQNGNRPQGNVQMGRPNSSMPGGFLPPPFMNQSHGQLGETLHGAPSASMGNAPQTGANTSGANPVTDSAPEGNSQATPPQGMMNPSQSGAPSMSNAGILQAKTSGSQQVVDMLRHLDDTQVTELDAATFKKLLLVIKLCNNPAVLSAIFNDLSVDSFSSDQMASIAKPVQECVDTKLQKNLNRQIAKAEKQCKRQKDQTVCTASVEEQKQEEQTLIDAAVSFQDEVNTALTTPQ